MAKNNCWLQAWYKADRSWQLCLTVWLYVSKSSVTEKAIRYCQLGNFTTRPGCRPYPRGNLHWKPVQCSKVGDANGRPQFMSLLSSRVVTGSRQHGPQCLALLSTTPSFLSSFLSGQRVDFWADRMIPICLCQNAQILVLAVPICTRMLCGALVFTVAVLSASSPFCRWLVREWCCTVCEFRLPFVSW